MQKEDGFKGRGRPCKTWSGTKMEDSKAWNIDGIMHMMNLCESGH